jgi:sulfate transport system ATP-binding protein
MSFIGETVAVDVVTSGGVARIGGQRIEAAGAARDGRSRLYLRPHEIKITAPQSGSLVGTIESIRRTALGHRLEVAIDNLATPIDLNVQETQVKLGDRIGLVLAAKSLVREDLEKAS